MKKIIITVGSITYAIKLKKLLKKQGISSSLIKLDNNSSGVGCVHGVSILESDFYSAVVVLRSNNIEYTLHKG